MTPRHGGELPQLELDCMNVLWRSGPAAVAAIREAVAVQGRPLAYTTVLTVMERLVRKHVVARRKQGRAFLYSPEVTRQNLRAQAVERLLRNYFDSPAELQQLLGGAAVAPAPVAAPADAVAPASNSARQADFDASLL